MRSFLAAAIQMRAEADADASVAHAVSLVDRALKAGAELVVLPEGCTGIGSSRVERAFDAEAPARSPALAAMLARSRRRGRAAPWIVLGGIPERAPDPARPYNTLAVLHDGAIVARYRKLHLFDARVPGAAPEGESATTSPGHEAIAIDTALGVLGPSICYDLRFGELYAAMAAAGAEIFLVPAAFTLRTGLAHVETLLRARAIEHGAWVISAAQHGVHGPGRESFGHAMIVDPWGTVVARAAPDVDAVVLYELDADRLEDVRARLPVHAHRRLPIPAARRVLPGAGDPP